jgi:hypothetical protein
LTIASGSTNYVCQTTNYTAGTGETAIIIARAGCTMPATATITVRAGYRVATNAPLGTGIGQQNTSGGSNRVVANTGTGTLALTAGATYAFSAAVDVSSTGVSGTCSCQTVAQIMRQ